MSTTVSQAILWEILLYKNTFKKNIPKFESEYIVCFKSISLGNYSFQNKTKYLVKTSFGNCF